MSKPLSEVLEELKNRFPVAVLSVEQYKGEQTVYVKKSDILSVAKAIKNDFGFNLLVDVFGTDRFTDRDRFEVIYHIRNIETADFIRLLVLVDESELTVESVSSVWSTANWHERETYDMFGVEFLNHPDLRRMYMPQDFAYFAMRKDFPLVGFEGSIPLPPKEEPKSEDR